MCGVSVRRYSQLGFSKRRARADSYIDVVQEELVLAREAFQAAEIVEMKESAISDLKGHKMYRRIYV
jgi:hypothetical protein